ncbi:MAG: AAA family ATPase [Thermodesulfobacteriota bacterium]
MKDRLFPDNLTLPRQGNLFGPEYYDCEVMCQLADTAVFHARSIARAKPVLIKTAMGHEASQKLFREYAMHKKAPVPGLMKLLGLEVVSGSTILVFEDDGARPLSLLAPAMFRDPAAFLPPALELCRIVERLHQQSITHQFLCPLTVFINPKSLSVSLAGLCHAFFHLRQPPGPWDGRLMEGSMEYAAPEQMGHLGRPVDGRCDIYGLGSLFFLMLAGLAPPPFQAEDRYPEKSPARSLRTANPDASEALCTIVGKCLATEPAARYQSVSGLYEDLHECMNEVQTGRPGGKAFAPGGHDLAARLWAPGPVRGRTLEKKALMSALARAVKGETVAVFATGCAGIGKTALLNEMRQQVVQVGGCFLAGGFSVLSRGRPFSGLGSAISNLSWDLLRKSPQVVSQTRKQLSEELAGHAGLLLQLAPEASFFLEAPPAPTELNPREAVSRRSLVFYRFFSALGRKQSVIALFLDDAQLADASSLSWIEELVCGRKLPHLLLLCAYREGPGEQFQEAARLLETIKRSGADITHLPLGPLSPEELTELVHDVAPGFVGETNSLAELTFARSGGNPLAAHQFLRSLADRGFLYFDPRQGGLVLDKKKARAVADQRETGGQSSLELMRLPAETLRYLSVASAVGPRFSAEVLETTLGAGRTAVFAALSLAAAMDLIRPEGSEPAVTYAFTHDSIREAAYALMPEDQASKVHRALALHFSAKQGKARSDEVIFAAAYHFRRASKRIDNTDDALKGAGACLAAGLLARERAAFPEAREHLSAGISMLPEDAWDQNHFLCLDLYTSAMEAEILAGSDQAAEELIRTALPKARENDEAIRLLRARFSALISQNRIAEALDSGIMALRLCHVSLSPKVSMVRAVAQFALSARAVCRLNENELANLPEARESNQETVLGLLFQLCFSSYSLSVPLFLSALSLAGKMLVKRGISPSGAAILAGMSFVLCSDFRFSDAMKLARAVDLLSLRFPGHPALARARCVRASFLLPWEASLRESARQSGLAAAQSFSVGLFEEAAMASFWECVLQFFAGEELGRVERRMAMTSAELAQSGEKVFSRLLCLWRQAVNNLAGLPENPCDLSPALEKAQEGSDMPRPEGNNLARLDFSLLTLMLCTLFGRYDQAVAHFQSASSLCDNEAGTQLAPIFNFYGALSLLSREEKPTSDSWKTIRKISARLEKWASQNPGSHFSKHLMVQAEMARAKGSPAEALRLLELGEQHAKKNGLAGERALCWELLGRLHLLLGDRDPGLAAMTRARQAYLFWGAMAKAKDIDLRFGALFLRPAGFPPGG